MLNRIRDSRVEFKNLAILGGGSKSGSKQHEPWLTCTGDAWVDEKNTELLSVVFPHPGSYLTTEPLDLKIPVSEVPLLLSFAGEFVAISS